MIEQSALIKSIIEGIQEKKGKAITHVDLSKLEYTGVDDFIICSGTSTMQVMAIADSVCEYVNKATDVKPFNSDGYQNAQWIVLDYGSIYVHVFLPEFRELYDLEQLWSDAVITRVPDID